MQQLKIFLIFCLLNAPSLLATSWQGEIQHSGEQLHYEIKAGPGLASANLHLGGLGDIELPTLDEALRLGERTIRAQNYARACFSPFCCFMPLIGIAVSRPSQKRLAEVRSLIRAAHSEDRTELTKFKTRVVGYLNAVASGQKEPPLIDEISEVESVRWRNMELEDVRAYIQKLNIAGSAVLGSQKCEQGIDVEVTNCCCCSESSVHFGLDHLAQSVVTNSKLLEETSKAESKPL